MDYLEELHLNRISEEEFLKKKESWEMIVQKYMPKFYRLEALPIYFNFFETEIIRREITEDLESFWASKIKKIVFATSARVYAYPNQVVSVRIMLARIYKIPKENIKDKDEEKEYEEMEKEDPNKLVEEEVDSDEERDKEEEANKKAAEELQAKEKKAAEATAGQKGGMEEGLIDNTNNEDGKKEIGEQINVEGTGTGTGDNNNI